MAFRLRVNLSEGGLRRVHVSADERYHLYLNSRLIGRGSERGTPDHWYYETYELDLQAGENVLVALAWALGEMAPVAQLSTVSTPSFLLACEGGASPDLDTGVAPWEVSRVTGYNFTGIGPAWGTGSKITLDGREYPWGVERGEAGEWHRAVPLREARSVIGPWGICSASLRPAALPPMKETSLDVGTVRHVRRESVEVSADGRVDGTRHEEPLSLEWMALFSSSTPVRVSARTRQVVIIDLGDYYCAYPELVISGGRNAEVRIHWAESLFVDRSGEVKGHRDEVDGRWFRGVGDSFIADGGQHRFFSTLWWEAGRYLEVVVTTDSEALVIERLGIRERRYPLELESSIDLPDGNLRAIIPVMMRSLQMCSHETYMDCPYYEQLMYVGDTRLEALVTYVVSRDSRLPIKAVELFGRSVDSSGLTASRYPAQGRQVIPGFSLFWISMVHDLALWRGERQIVSRCLPQIRAILEAFLAYRNADGLVRIPEGWHFVDWVPSWTNGCPPIGSQRVCGITSWQLVLALRQAAELENWTGVKALADHYRTQADEVARVTEAAFYSKTRGLMADDLNQQHWSEHANAFCLLAQSLSPERAKDLARSMEKAGDNLAQATIYFSHYYLEAVARFGSMESFFQRLELWSELLPNGFKTTYETPGNSRSDCHAWGAHPLYHFFSTVLGIRPSAFGFQSVVIRPRLGNLASGSCSLVHPQGSIDVSLERDKGGMSVSITLPSGVDGIFEMEDSVFALKPGLQSFRL